MKRLILLVLAGSAWIVPAKAQTCNASVTGASFGTVDSLTPATYQTTATLAVTCSLFSSGDTIAICPDLGAGSGSSNGSSQRLLSGPGGSFAFQIYSDAYSSPWGSVGSYGASSVPLLTQTGNGTQSKTLYLSLNSSGGPATPGLYSSSFTPTVKYGAVASTSGGCGALTLSNITNAPFTVQASLNKSCTLNVTQNINFGTLTSLTSGANASGALTLKCTNETAYEIALNNGLNGGTQPNARIMKSSAANTMVYGLYQDASYAKVWGSTAGAGGNTVAGSGNGSQATVPVYGHIPPQATPQPGVYNDTVIVTVTY